ncbi:MAG: caspase family protein [Pseudomonadota bacterium]
MQARLRAPLAMFLFVIWILSLSSPSFAERRVALVIGNGDYSAVQKLINPRNDAREMASALTRLGFHVHEGFDLDRAAMTKVIRDFSSSLHNADIALFFYAGHAVQIDGRNHLIPTEAEIQSEADLDLLTIDLRLILRQMERNATNSIVLLDACRDNPFRSVLYRSLTTAPATRGMARANMVGSSLIGYATDPGEVAADGSDGHSPFTRALLRRIETPGVDITRALRDVRRDVLIETNYRQRPSVVDNLLEDVYLAGLPQKSTNPLEVAARAWEAIKFADTIEQLEAFLAEHGETPFGDLARARIRELSPKPLATSPGAIEVSPPTDQTAALNLPNNQPTTEWSEAPQISAPSLDTPLAIPQDDLISGPELISAIQKELTRLRCDTNGADGIWGPNSNRALSSFNAETGLDFESADIRLLNSLREMSGPICKVSCDNGGQLRNGACINDAPPASQRTPVCYSFNGRELCN